MFSKTVAVAPCLLFGPTTALPLAVKKNKKEPKVEKAVNENENGKLEPFSDKWKDISEVRWNRSDELIPSLEAVVKSKWNEEPFLLSAKNLEVDLESTDDEDEVRPKMSEQNKLKLLRKSLVSHEKELAYIQRWQKTGSKEKALTRMRTLLKTLVKLTNKAFELENDHEGIAKKLLFGKRGEACKGGFAGYSGWKNFRDVVEKGNSREVMTYFYCITRAKDGLNAILEIVATKKELLEIVVRNQKRATVDKLCEEWVKQEELRSINPRKSVVNHRESWTQFNFRNDWEEFNGIWARDSPWKSFRAKLNSPLTSTPVSGVFQPVPGSPKFADFVHEAKDTRELLSVLPKVLDPITERERNYVGKKPGKSWDVGGNMARHTDSLFATVSERAGSYRTCGGPSGTATKTLTLAKMMGYTDSELSDLRDLLIAYLVPLQSHSIFEVAVVSEPFMGLGYRLWRK